MGIKGEKMRTLRIGLAQINPTVGDLKGNTQKILDYIMLLDGRKGSW